MTKAELLKFDVNEEQRSITFSCASTSPYTRYDEDADYLYEEILVINESAVDMTRLNNGAPLLFNHDTDKLIGVVEKAWIADEKVYVKVRFRSDDYSVSLFNDILAGIVKNVSIGYQITDMEQTIEDDVVKRYVTQWMLYEVSIVSIPADDRVGIRSLNTNITHKKELNIMEENTKECGEKPDDNVLETKAEEAPVEEAPASEEEKEEVITQAEIDALVEENKQLKAENEALKAEKENEDDNEKEDEAPEENADKEDIEKIGEDFGVSKEEVDRAIADKLTVREFKNKVKSLINININKKEDKKMNREFTDFLKARDYNKTFVMRDFTGFAPAGIVPTETLPIEKILELKMAVNGYRSISGIRGNITVPVQNSRATVYTPGVNQASTDSVPGVTNKTLSAVKFTASVVIGKEALELSNSDSEAFIIGQITDEIAYKFEAYLLGKVLAGAGTTINYSAISAVDWDDILAFEAAVAPYNINQPYFVMSAGSRAALKGILKAQNTAARFICEDNRINDYEARVSGCISDSNIYFGDFSKLLVANFGNGLEITIDPYTEARSGNIVVVGSYLADAAILHADAFAIGKTQSSSSSQG